MTVLGIVIAIAGLAVSLVSRKWLYRLFLLSIPFSGTSVINVGTGLNASGVQVWMYLGSLLLLRDLCGWLVNPDARLAPSFLKRFLPLGIFILVLTLSLLMPIYINGKLEIEAPTLTDFSSSPLYFSSRNATTFLYVVFGALLTISIARRNIQPEEVRMTERTYLLAGIVTCILGVSEFVAHLVNLPSPTVLFRNSASPGAAGNLALLEGVGRVSSVAVEPSVLTLFLCTVVPLTLPALLGRGYIYSRRIDRWCFFLFLLTLLLTTSTAAYAVLIFAPILCLPVISKLGIKITRGAFYSLLGLFTLGCASAGLYSVSSTAQQVLNAALLTKGESYSALERLKTISLAWEYFKQYPVLGVGWGSVTSDDLICFLLANSGLMGLLAFSLILVGIAHPILRQMTGTPDRVSASRGVWLLSVVLLIAACVVTTFPFVFGFLWMVIAMGIAAGSTDYLKKDAEPARSTVLSRAVRT